MAPSASDSEETRWHATGNCLRTYLDVNTGIANLHSSSAGEGERNLESKVSKHVSGKGFPAVSTSKDVTTGIVTSFMTSIHNQGGGYGKTSIRQCHEGELDCKNDFDHSLIEDTDGGVRHRFRITIGNDGYVGNTNIAACSTEDPYDGDAEDLPNFSSFANISARKVTHTRLGRKTKELMPKLSDDALMKKYLRAYGSLITHPKEPLEGQRMARLAHIYQDGRTFGFASALVKEGERTLEIVSVIWQTRTHPRRAVCLSFHIRGRGRILTAVCTCCPLRLQTENEDISCSHARTCFDTPEILSSIRHVLTGRGDETERGSDLSYFGDCIYVDNTETPRALKLALKRNRQSSVLARKWKFEIVFDVDQRIFLPVLKVQGRPTRCLLCRGNPERRMRCAHEEACRKGKNRSVVEPRQNQKDEYDISDEAEWDTDDPPPIARFPRRNRSVRIDADETEEYAAKHITRPVLPCKGMMHDMEWLIDKLDENEQKDYHDQEVCTCHVCGIVNVWEPVERYKRPFRLFTLTQGTVDINVHDWYCPTCTKMRRYSGSGDAIYPAGKTYGYSMELMYFWLNQVCLQGLSFRAAYKTTNLLCNSPGLRHRNRKTAKFRTDRDIGDNNRSRRRASTAFHDFLRTIDTGNEVMSSKLFSCPTCEVSVTPMDCKELGIDMERSADMKRLRAVVIDGTAAGILNRLPNMERKPLEIRNINEGVGDEKVDLDPRLVKTAAYRKLLDKLIKSTREILRCVMKKKRTGQNRNVRSVRFWLTHDSDDVRGIEKMKKPFTKLESRLIRLLCTKNTCLCPEGPTRNDEGENIHSHDCEDLCTKVLKNEEHKEVIAMLSEVFGITTSIQSLSLPVGSEHAQIGDQSGVETEMDDEDDSDSSGSSSDENESNHENAAMMDRYTDCGPILQMLLQNAIRNPQLAESLLSLLHLLLVEHITMPYLSRVPGHGESSESPSMLSFTKVFLNLHSSVACCLHNLVNCSHIETGHAISLQDDCDCNAALRKAVISMQDANPILEAFCAELLKERRPFPSQFASMLTSLVHLILHHIQIATNFFEKFEAECPDSIRDYWEKYSSIEPQDVQGLVPDNVETGIWFPGRKQCRPGITFSSKDACMCNKKYTKSQRHSAGILTLQCACQSPKLFGFIIMTRAESVSLALSSMLTHFPILPRTI